MLRAAIVDAFTTVPFAGNPAGIVMLDKDDRNASWMQSVARELGLSETAFLLANGAGRYRMRWFTPANEMQLCGHATLAAAHWLWHSGETADPLVFDTRSGPLRVSRDDADARIWLDFPVVPVVDATEPADWRRAFPNADVEWVGRTGGIRERDRKALLVTDARTVRALRPDLERVAELPCGGVIVTGRSDVGDADVVTRYFAPACGVAEDPVTGSAHCTIGWYWAPVLGTTALRARQVSPRGGDLRVEVAGDRVRLGGNAVTVADLDLIV